MKKYDENFGMHAGAKPELFRFAEKLRAKMTEAEKELWEYLRRKPQGYKFRRQHPFSLHILDFYCHKLRLAIEIDGIYHEFKKQKLLDGARTDNINRLGIHELRFTNHAVLNNFEAVIQSIESYIKQKDRG